MLQGAVRELLRPSGLSEEQVQAGGPMENEGPAAGIVHLFRELHHRLEVAFLLRPLATRVVDHLPGFEQVEAIREIIGTVADL